MTFEEAAKLFATARYPGRGKPLANNTRLFCRKASDGFRNLASSREGVHPVDGLSPDWCYAVRLHATDVVTIFADGTYALDSGGWHTVTTRDRMNSYLRAGVRVSSRQDEMYVVTDHVREDSEYGDWSYPAHRVPFYEGMVIQANGRVDDGDEENWSAFSERLREEAREDARRSREKRLRELLTAFTTGHGRGRLPYTWRMNLRAGHLEREVLDTVGTQVLRTVSGNVLAVAHPQRQEQWAPTLIEINRDARSKVAGKLVSYAHAAESRVVLLDEDDITREAHALQESARREREEVEG